MRDDIYKLKSAMRKNVFLYNKTGPAPVWLDIKKIQQYFSFSYLNEEIDYGRKYEGQRMHTEPQKITICGIEECEYAVHFRNCGIK